MKLVIGGSQFLKNVLWDYCITHFETEKLWIIDFEHAVCEESPAASYRMNQHADFIDEFCNWTPGMSKKWNPYFK